MALWHKRANPVERAMDDLNRQIAALEKQQREMEQQKRQSQPRRATGSDTGDELSPLDAATGFVKQMLTPPKHNVTPSYRVQRELFDAGAEPLKDLDAQPITFANKSGADLFTGGTTGASNVAGQTTGSETVERNLEAEKRQEKLVHYLSAGSIKSYKPLKRAQRQTRNRFFMWLALSFVALWLIYFVVR